MLALRIGIVAALLFALPVAARTPAGRYRMHEPEVAAELELKPDGSFTYFFSAGSLDEHAMGKWRVDGAIVRLETIPKPVPATFAAGTVGQAKGERLVLHVVSPQGQGIAAVDLVVGFDSGDPAEGYTQDYGWSLAEGDARVPRWVEFAVPIYGLRSQRFAIDSAQGNELTFVLTPNDIGTLDMADISLEVRPDGLVMHRNGGELLFDAEH